MVSMNDMAKIIMSFDNKDLPIEHIPGPEGVRGRNSDNTLIKEKLGWSPTMKLAVSTVVTALDASKIGASICHCSSALDFMLLRLASSFM